MKSFKLTADGDLSFTDGDKMKPYTIIGKSYQTGIPSLDNPLPIIGVTTPFFYDYDGNISTYKPERLVLHGLTDSSGNVYADTLEVDPIKRKCTLTRRVGLDLDVTNVRGATKINSYVEAYLTLRDDKIRRYDKQEKGIPYLCSHVPNEKNSFDECVYSGYAWYYAFDNPCILKLKAEYFTEEELADMGPTSQGKLLPKAVNTFLQTLPQPMQVLFPLEEDDVKVFEFPYTSNYNHQIEMVEGAELTCQKIKTVLGTNKGEWFFDEEEGINFDNIIGKKKWGNDESSSAVINDTGELNAILKNRLDGVQ